MATVEASTLKKWLLRRAHGLLGTSRLEGQLAQISEELRSLQGIVRSLPMARADERPGPDEESLRRLRSQGLFILGAARSGTTILTRCLNRAHDVLLLEEPDLYFHEEVADFVAFFNDLHRSMGNRGQKGTYLAQPVFPETGPLAALLRLARDYRYVGAKTAIGPHEYLPNWQQLFLDYQSKYFLHGKYVCIMRTPVESIWSMNKMFPDRQIPLLFDAWLQAAALSLDCYKIFPHTRFIFFDELSEATLDHLADWLDVPVPRVAGTIDRSRSNSALRGGTVPAPLRPFASLCRDCTELYTEIRQAYSNDDGVYGGPVSEWGFYDGCFSKIDTLLKRLPTDDARDFRIRLAAA